MLVDTENPPESKPEAAAPAPAHSHLRVRSDLHEEYSADEIAKMTELYEGTLSNIEEGEIVKSKVLRVTDTAVILDVGFKSEGAVPIDESKDARSLKEGDVVEVFLEHLEDQEGAVVLSKKKADFMRVWERIREAHEKDEAVSGTLDRKSTRLNSSHLVISYAVFCLQKKTADPQPLGGLHGEHLVRCIDRSDRRSAQPGQLQARHDSTDLHQQLIPSTCSIARAARSP